MPGGGSAPGMGGNLAMFGRAATGAPQAPGAGLHMNTAETAAMGRFGDSIMAHLTPGEITIPIQLQSPAVLKAIREEFKKVGVDPSKFVAGSPTGSRNPQTGAQEFALLGGMLPSILGLVGGLAGSAVAPGVGTAIGAGLGSAAGEAASGGTPTQDLITGAGGALGSAAGPAVGAKLGGMVGSGAAGAAGGAAANAAGSAAGQAATGAATSGLGSAAGNAAGGAASGALGGGAGFGAGQAAGGLAASPLGGAAAAPAATAAPGLLGQLMSSRTIGGGVGAAFGSAEAGPIMGKQTSPWTNNANQPLGAPNPNFNQALGNQNASRVGFQNYDPVKMAQQGGGYDFYSPTGNGQSPQQ